MTTIRGVIPIPGSWAPRTTLPAMGTEHQTTAAGKTQASNWNLQVNGTQGTLVFRTHLYYAESKSRAVRSAGSGICLTSLDSYPQSFIICHANLL